MIDEDRGHRRPKARAHLRFINLVFSLTMTESPAHSLRAARIHLDVPKYAYFIEGKLKDCYDGLQEKEELAQSSFPEFIATIFPRLNGDAISPEEIVRQALGEKDSKEEEKRVEKLMLGPIIVAVVFLVRAKGLLQGGGDTNIAWSYLTDAAYWTGVSVSGRSLQDLKRREHSKKGVVGADRRKEQYDPIKAVVMKLLQDHWKKPKSGWRSARKAANDIFPQVWEFVENSEMALPGIAQSTIENWIPDLSELKEHFHPDSAIRKKWESDSSKKTTES